VNGGVPHDASPHDASPGAGSSGSGKVPVLLAVTGAPCEAQVLAHLREVGSRVHVVRRCVDLTDLLTHASAGPASVAVVAGSLRRLDVEVVARLAAHGVVVVAVHEEGPDPGGEASAVARLRALGAVGAISASAGPEALARAVLRAAKPPPEHAGTQASPVTRSADFSSFQPPGPREGPPDDPPARPRPAARGKLLAVWGPIGAPGRTSVAITLADELARVGTRTLLADADTYGAAVAQQLGMLDESSGLAAASRLAANGTLDVEGLASCARALGPRLSVLSGLTRPDRWPELRPSALQTVWEVGRALASWVVVDCGFCLEQDEELLYDTVAPRRNGATTATLAAADVVIVVGSGDVVGTARLVRALPEVRALSPRADLRVVVTRVRRAASGSNPEAQVRAALEAHAGVTTLVLVPEDRPAHDAALLAGRTLADVAPGSPARAALIELAHGLSPASAPVQHARRRRAAPATS
jgi:Flp pilus assembly CpaE family ATPase